MDVRPFECDLAVAAVFMRRRVDEVMVFTCVVPKKKYGGRSGIVRCTFTGDTF